MFIKYSDRIFSLTLQVVAVAVIACLLLVFESDFLWKLQETNLFLPSGLFFREQMVEPGGLLTWLSTWFTQFFYYPWLGVVLLCGWWLLLMWLVQRTFRLSSRWTPVAIIPVLFLLVSIVDLGYWIYILKLRGHAFLSTIGTTAVVALLLGFRSLVERVSFHPTLVRSVFVFLTCTAGYPLLGVYGLGAAGLMALWIWRLESRRRSALVVSVVGLFSVLLLPLFFYRFVYHQINVANVYVAKLPLFVVTEEYTSYYIPYLLLLLFLLVMVCLPFSLNSKPSTLNSKKPSPLNSKLSTLNFTLSALILLAAFFYTYKSWYSDENFHRELAMQRCIDRLDWEAAVKVAAEQKDEPTRAIVMMRNLALARLGRQGDEMYRYRNGCKRCDAPFDIRAINTVGALIYYHYGMPNYCYRLCMERGVEFGWRAEQLKYMARCCILNGEQQLARKYLRLLRQTRFHKAWADDFRALAEHPEDITQSPEMEFITHMMHYDNELTSDHNLVENFLMKRLMYSNFYRDPIFLEQVLYASMAAKNASLFWPHLYNYSQFYPDRPWPYHVQEAAYLFGMMEGRPNMDRCPVSLAVRESYKQFNAAAPLYEGQSLEQVQQALRPAFGQTYYFDYYLVNFPAQN